MSLRPRYSLLTLLLLTAAVAGGVKLWRGPHQTFMLYPSLGMWSPHHPTPKQEELLRRTPLQPSLLANPTLEYRFETINTLAGFEYLMIRGHSQRPLDLIYSLDPPGNYARGWHIERQRTRPHQLQYYMRDQI